jgi:hypothetical protein
MKILKIIEPKVKRAIYKLPKRVIKRKWLPNKVLEEGWYYCDDPETPAVLTVRQEFIVPDKNSPDINYICEYGKLVTEDEGKTFISRLDFIMLKRVLENEQTGL